MPDEKVNQSGEGNAAADGSANTSVHTADDNLPASHIQGDVIRGDKVGGDKVGRDKTVNIYNAAPSGVNSLHQLPPPPRDFTGREAEIEELMQAFETGGVTISGLQGQGGVGKTTLALKLAEKLKDRYPDAQFYFDLKGVSPQPLSSADAMAHVIRAYHPTAKLPESEAELRATYNSVLHDQRALLLMDNAKDRDQVEPLIPPESCLLIVTSRRRFTLPGMFDKDLGTMSTGDSQKLLLKIAPRIGDLVDELAKLCGYLPIALRLAASALAERRDLKPAEYLRRLADAKHRLPLIDASLGLSYDLLDAQMQKLWCALAVFPDSFDALGAAAVCEVEKSAAQDMLSELLSLSLLEWKEDTERYRLHDLSRIFADLRLTDSERDKNALLHASHYQWTSEVANEFYLKGGQAVIAALAQFDSELVNIRAGQAWAAQHAGGNEEAGRLCIDYPLCCSDLLLIRLHPREKIAWLDASLSTARQLKDKDEESYALLNLGNEYRSLGEVRKAIECYDQSLLIAREIGDQRGEAASLSDLGHVYKELGEVSKAIEYYDQSLLITREIGDRRGEGLSLIELGRAYMDLGEVRKAIEYYNQSLLIAREIGDRRVEVSSLRDLGYAYHDLGESGEEIEYCVQSLLITREIGDRLSERTSLNNLGFVLRDLGESRKAIECYDQSLVIAREVGDRQGEAASLSIIGSAYEDLREIKKAIAYYDQSLVMAREIGDRRGEAASLNKLGCACKNLGEVEKAIEYHNQSLLITREIADRRAEGRALISLGIAYSELGQVRKAIEYYEQELVITRETGNRRGEGQTLINLGLAYHDLGELEKAIECYDQSRVITCEIGDRRGEAQTLHELGNAYKDLGEVRKAIEHYEQSLMIKGEIGDPRSEVLTLISLGIAYSDLGELRKGIECYDQSLEIAREIGEQRGEAYSLHGKAVALDKLGNRKQAIQLMEAALETYGQIEDSWAKQARDVLAGWRGNSTEDETTGTP